MRCYYCKENIPPDSAYCPQCGSPQMFTEALISSAMDNDSSAIESLYLMTKDNVYFLIHSMVKDEDIASDLMQDTYLKAFRSLGQLRSPTAFRGWVKTIGHNLTVDYFRKRKPAAFSELVSLESEDLPEFRDERVENLPEVAVDRQETAQLLKEILGSIAEDQRIVISMYYYQQMSVSEIADELNVNQNTIKSRLSLGRKNIEKKVLALEKRGTRLYSLTPWFFFLSLLSHGEETEAAVRGGDKEFLAQLRRQLHTVTGKPAASKRKIQPAKAGKTQEVHKAVYSMKTGASRLALKKVIASVAAIAVIGGGGAGIAYKMMSPKPELIVNGGRETEQDQKEAKNTREENNVQTAADTEAGSTAAPEDASAGKGGQEAVATTAADEALDRFYQSYLEDHGTASPAVTLQYTMDGDDEYMFPAAYQGMTGDTGVMGSFTADLDQDGTKELVISTLEHEDDLLFAKLLVYRMDGNEVVEASGESMGYTIGKYNDYRNLTDHYNDYLQAAYKITEDGTYFYFTDYYSSDLHEGGNNTPNVLVYRYKDSSVEAISDYVADFSDGSVTYNYIEAVRDYLPDLIDDFYTYAGGEDWYMSRAGIGYDEDDKPLDMENPFLEPLNKRDSGIEMIETFQMEPSGDSDGAGESGWKGSWNYYQ